MLFRSYRRYGLIVFQFNALQSYCQRAGVAREALGLAAKEVARELVEQHKQRQPPFGPRGPAVKPPGQRRCDGGRETGANPLMLNSSDLRNHSGCMACMAASSSGCAPNQKRSTPAGAISGRAVSSRAFMGADCGQPAAQCRLFLPLFLPLFF